MTFEELGVNANLVARLSQKGIVNPTPIQSETFAPLKERTSILGMAKTGTGKTLAYVLPLFDRWATSTEDIKGLRVLVLVPTRELASQVHASVELVSGKSEMGVVVVGGESEEIQMRQSQNARVMIATPGRLLDLLKRRMVDLSQVETVVFDEADRLLDMGFVDDMRDIMRMISKPNQQLLFFSATTHFGIDEMAYEFGVQDLVRIGKESDELTVDGLDHRVAFVGEHEKYHALVNFLFAKKEERGIVFSNFREKAHDISSRLRKLGCKSETLTAQLTQGARSKIMEQFRSGAVQVLIASDLAARGIDVSDLDFVVNVDLPEDPATYVHRVGRTARAGKKGLALSLAGFEDTFRLEKLERFLGHKMERYQFESAQLEGVFPRFAEHPLRDHGDSGGEGRGREGRYAGDRDRDSRRGPAPRERGREGQRGGSAPNQPRQQQVAPRPQQAAASRSAPVAQLPAIPAPSVGFLQSILKGFRKILTSLFGKSPRSLPEKFPQQANSKVPSRDNEKRRGSSYQGHRSEQGRRGHGEGSHRKDGRSYGHGGHGGNRGARSSQGSRNLGGSRGGRPSSGGSSTPPST